MPLSGLCGLLVFSAVPWLVDTSLQFLLHLYMAFSSVPQCFKSVSFGTHVTLDLGPTLNSV